MSSKAGPQDELAQTYHKASCFAALVSLLLVDLGPPDRSRMEPEQMGGGFHQYLVLGGLGGGIALLIHLEHLQELIWSN